jgi:c-di-GMP-binding flagellar brake protein YcgR
MNLSSREYQEKRDFIRMRIDSPVEVHIVGNDQPLTGVCRDLSGGGMLVEVECALPPGTEVEVTLTSSHGHAPMLRATATVTRLVAQPDSGKLPNKVGLRLKEILA